MNSNYYPPYLAKDNNNDFALLDEKNNKINKFKKINSNLWQTILFKLKADWTYNSNSIEGSTLSKGDTIFFKRRVNC